MGIQEKTQQYGVPHAALMERERILALLQKEHDRLLNEDQGVAAAALSYAIHNVELGNHYPTPDYFGEWTFEPVDLPKDSAFAKSAWSAAQHKVEAKARDLLREHKDGSAINRRAIMLGIEIERLKGLKKPREVIQPLVDELSRVEATYWAFKQDPRLLACMELRKQIGRGRWAEIYAVFQLALGEALTARSGAVSLSAGLAAE